MQRRCAGHRLARMYGQTGAVMVDKMGGGMMVDVGLMVHVAVIARWDGMMVQQMGMMVVGLLLVLVVIALVDNRRLLLLLLLRWWRVVLLLLQVHVAAGVALGDI